VKRHDVLEARGSEHEHRGGRVAVLALAVAGAGHLLAALDHLTHDPRFTAFFLAVGIAQLLVAGKVRDGTRAAVVGSAVAATVLLLVLYLVSRTVALPLGPHSDRPEDPDLLGMLVVLAEVTALATLPALLADRGRRIAVDLVLLTGIGTWVAWLTGLIG
jgi:uncharacterized membrane protein